MSDPFREEPIQRPQAASLGQYHVPMPTTPTRGYGFLQNQTPSGDAFASINSPHNLRVLLHESELVKATLRKDLALTREEVNAHKEEVEKLKDEVKLLEERINQQEVTIKTQSRTIQDPRSLRVRRAMNGSLAVETANTQPWLTPPQTAHHFGHTPQSLTLHHAQQPSGGRHVLPHAHPNPPPQNNHGSLPYHLNQPAVGQVSSQRGSDGNTAGAGVRKHFEPIVPIMRSSSPTMGIAETTQQKTITTTSSLSSEVVSPFQASPYPGFEFETKATDFGGRFRALWARSDQFAKIYGNNLVEIHVEFLPANLKDHMMLNGNEDIAMQYLNNSVARRLYVSKVINFYLCKRIFKYTEIVRGFDSGIDGEVANLKRMIAHDTPPVARHALLSGIAHQVILARQNPRFGDFCRGSKDAHSYQLRMLLDPLLLVRDRDFSAQEMLMDIISDAQTLGLELYSCPYDARFHFPELEEIYDPTCMVNMGAHYGMSLIKDAKVTLSVTPFIRLGLNQSEPARVRNVCNAKVFTTLPGSEEAPISLTPGRLP